MERLTTNEEEEKNLVLYTLSVNDGPKINYTGDLPIFTINWLLVWTFDLLIIYNINLKFDGQFDLLDWPLIEYAVNLIIIINFYFTRLYQILFGFKKVRMILV